MKLTDQLSLQSSIHKDQIFHRAVSGGISTEICWELRETLEKKPKELSCDVELRVRPLPPLSFQGSYALCVKTQSGEVSQEGTLSGQWRIHLRYARLELGISAKGSTEKEPMNWTLMLKTVFP
jgi:hypothetical protein